LPERAAVMVSKDGFTPRIAVPGSQVARPTSLLQELLDHAQRHLVPMGDFGSSSLFLVLGKNDPFTQI
jgi:hypothetical protein